MFPVRRIYLVGRNYLEHVREMKEGADERDPPFFFQKPRDAIVPNAATVPYPSVTQNLFLLPTSNPAPEPSSRASARP
jgi:fumarylpyruvate hydrolase